MTGRSLFSKKFQITERDFLISFYAIGTISSTLSAYIFYPEGDAGLALGLYGFNGFLVGEAMGNFVSCGANFDGTFGACCSLIRKIIITCAFFFCLVFLLPERTCQLAEQCVRVLYREWVAFFFPERTRDILPL